MMKALYRKSKILIHENQFMPQAVLYINCMGVWEYLLWCVPSLIECPLMYEINVLTLGNWNQIFLETVNM